jgi:hypothetical protein
VNRIAQRRFEPSSVAGLETLHDRLVQGLGRSVPPSVVALYARPVTEPSGQVTWSSAVEGQPVAYTSLSATKQKELDAQIFLRLDAIRAHAVSLATIPNSDPSLIALLRDASQPPPIEAVYSVGGQPILLFWDSAIASKVKRPALIRPVLPATTSNQGHRVLPWMVGALGVLLALFLLWWLFCPISFRHPPQSPPQASVSPPESPAQSPNATPQAPEPVTPPAVKPTPEPIPEPEPEPQPKLLDSPVEEPPAEPVKPEPPEPPPPPPPAPPPPPPPKPVVKPPATIDNAKNLCPSDRPPELAPEMVVMFDASGSMALNIEATPEDEKWLGQLKQRASLPGYRLTDSEMARYERLTADPTRISIARQATINVVRRLPRDVRTGLVVAENCPTATNMGRFAAGQSGQLINRLSQLTPKGGTPLGDGLYEAGQLVDGVTREATILLVSDGAESCNGDPCYVAQQLKKAKPHLKINVVDIGGTGAAACVAAITGGKVYTAKTVNELNISLDRAAQDALGPSNCKK